MANNPATPHAAADAGQCALDALDGILAHEPVSDQHLFSKATACLSTYRDELVGHFRPGLPTTEQRTRLEHVNAVISILMAGHFPLGELPWGELRKAREWLDTAVRQPVTS